MVFGPITKHIIEISNPAKITVSGGKIKISILFDNTWRNKTFPIAEVFVIVLKTDRVSISKSVLDLALEGRFMIILNEKQGKVIYGNYENYEIVYNQVLTRIDKEKRLEFAKEIVRSRIKAMMKILKSLSLEVYEIEDYLSNVEKEVNVSGLRSQEANATKIYYDQLRIFLRRKDVEFLKRSRPARDLVNAMLNYGNALLYRIFLGYVLLRGFNPHIGIYHRLNENSLIYDLTDPYKPLIVDKAMIHLIDRDLVSECSLVKNRLALGTRQNLTNQIFKYFDSYEEKIVKTLNSLFYFVKHYPSRRFEVLL